MVQKKNTKKSQGKSKRVTSINQRLGSIEKQQVKILELQKKFLNKETKISKKEDVFLEFEKKAFDEEKFLEGEETQALYELKKIEQLEENIKKKMGESPLRRITYRDITKGMIGAFFGIVGHFSFAKGVEISEHFSYIRSTGLYIASFVIIILFLYFSGFRKINEQLMFKFMPLRAIVLYFSSLITVLIVLLLYGKIDFTMEFSFIYNTIAAISVLAVLGAGTADLIGKNE